MSDKPANSFDARDVIGVVGLTSLGVGISQFSWPAALIVVGVVLIAVAAGYLR
ncbi:hypothetical protein JQ600_35575 [Bradyrhizobium sp. AUGA SZCCT0176]|uniref:hypothetical protein n=1 Tax=Bradyrhizobium sp. AUGA SZCCT0176 TaxID=2807664 RepID=UPI001BA5C591|nr:hypothetical protein [Bradyrhizobium sp. AUGA SZCCT0176]MBR1230218.1 hypothetical protein [Bradyrhizobium sp. AUGA SZCCT0176]